MARPRTPTATLKARGSFVAHPERFKARGKEPKPSAALGKPPANLTEAQRKCWDEIAELAPPFVLMNCDRFLVEIAAKLLAQSRTEEGLVIGERNQLMNCLSRMGMTPADRSKVNTGSGEEQEDVWDTFAVN
jgi:hypothetical protein